MKSTRPGANGGEGRDEGRASPVRDASSLAAGIYAGALAGLFLSLVLSRFVWLEMRVKTGLLIPVCALGPAVFRGRAGRLLPGAGLWAILAVQGVLILLILAAGDFDPASLAVLPAALVRDGLGLSGVPLATLDWWLLGAVVLGNAAWAAAYRSASPVRH